METKVKKTTSISPEIPYTSSSSSTSSLELTTSDNEHSVINVNNISELHSKNAEYKPKLISRCKAISPNLLKTINKRVVIVDCRYPYEYNAGHIRGAINLADWPSLCQYFFGAKQINESSVTDMHSLSLSLPKLLVGPKPSRTLFVLHCEFSSKRAPELFQLLRNHDRTLNFSSYPALRYPQVYILHGGYAAFFKGYPHLCQPSGYLQMHSRPHLLSYWRKHCKRVNQKSIHHICQRYCDDNEDEEFSTGR
ncbi:unnamed protein product [Heterobilharzia americana]|nr:unnamed protein product [Heterobilharzia americana]